MLNGGLFSRFAESVSTNTKNFSGEVLTNQDTNLQKCLNTLDSYISQTKALDGKVEFFADLPDPSLHDNEVWLVTKPSGGLFLKLNIYKYPAGMYTPSISGTKWEISPLHVKSSEDALTLVNITDWQDFLDINSDITLGDLVVYNDISYKNLTGSLSSTSPDVDVANWQRVTAFVINGTSIEPVVSGENLDMLSGGVITSFTEFDTTLSAPAYKEGLQYYDSISKAISHYTEIAGVAPFRIGRALRSRAVSDDITPIVKGDILRISGGTSGTSPLVVKSQANVLKYVQETIGMAMNDAIQGGVVYIAVFDTIIGVNTLGTQVNDLVYLDPNNAGKFTFIQPKAPDYSLAFGFVTKVGETDGVISVRFGGYTGSDTSVNLEGFLNGIVTNTPQVDISVSGGIIYADVTNEEEPTKDLPFLIGDKRYLLNTTTNTGLGGAARVVVPAGADAQTLQESVIYAYLDNGVPTLGINSINPSLPYAKICDLSVFNATRTLADGRPFKYRRSNNTIDLKNGVIDGSKGLMIETLDNLRQKLGTNWVSGQDATPTVDNTQIRVALSGGVGRQFREANIPAFDGLLYTIFNDETNTITYENTTNLTAITQTAGGSLDDLLQNNRYYIIRLFYMLNSNGVGNTVLATRPTGYYTADGDAFRNDTSSYAVTVNAESINEIVYPLYDLFIGRTGAGGSTITLVDIVDKKTRIPFGGTGGGSAGAGVTTFDGLSDTPADKIGQALKLLQVNAGETAIEFVDGSTKFVDLSTNQSISGEKEFDAETVDVRDINGVTQAKLNAIGDSYVSNSLTVGGKTVDNKAILDLQSTTKGLLPPRMTTAQRDAIDEPTESLTIYNIDNNRLETFDGTYWYGETLTGTTASRPTSIRIGTMYLDTDLGYPIWWDGTNWINATGASV